MFRALPALLLTVCVVSCSTLGVNNQEGYIIRYINLEIVYEYELSKSGEALALKIKKQNVIKKIKESELSMSDSTTDTEIEHYKNELVRLTEEEKSLKASIYQKIKTAVETVSKKYDVDFLLNTGEGVVYSRPVFDLTADVVAELEKMDKNSSAIWK